MNNRKYEIIFGSKSYFNQIILEKIIDGNQYKTFIGLIKESDEKRQNGQKFEDFANIMVIENSDYQGITEQAHDRIGSLIEELSTDDSTIYIHNPTIRLSEYLDSLPPESITKTYEERIIVIDEEKLIQNMLEISKKIKGQIQAVHKICTSIWYLNKSKQKKPYVIMLYGNSGLGKTESVKQIADHFYDGKMIEKHLSMFQNNTYSDYFFGEKPNRKTLGFDLLERKSNLIFFDELDKCPEHFYSAFYTLFDNTTFVDASYEAEISGLLIFLTSNYLSQNEMKEKLGVAIYNRIDKFIFFNDFDIDTIDEITKNEINNRKDEYSQLITPEELYSLVSNKIGQSGENARTIKYKVQQVIESVLYEELFRKIMKKKDETCKSKNQSN